MYKEDLTLNNLQWLICHKIKPNYNESLWKKKLDCCNFNSE